MGTLKKIEWTEGKVQGKLKSYFLAPNSKKYEITNLFVYGWESDYLAITRSMIAHEIEIKISRADFRNDFKNKEDKHLLFEHFAGGEDGAGKYLAHCPNYFYYAVPEGLVGESEVPGYAGLIYVSRGGISEVKKPVKLTDEKFSVEAMQLTDKFYWNMENWKKRYADLSTSVADVKRLLLIEKNYGKDVAMYEEMLEERDEKIAGLEWKVAHLEEKLSIFEKNSE